MLWPLLIFFYMGANSFIFVKIVDFCDVSTYLKSVANSQKKTLKEKNNGRRTSN